MATFGGLTSLEIAKDGEVKVTPLIKGTSALAEFVANTHLYYTGFRRDALEVLQDQNQALEEDANPQRSQVEDSLKRIHELGYAIKDAIVSDNYDRWGELLHTHWIHKKNLSSKISLTRVDQIYEEVRRNCNVLGGKISGAGGGGFLMLYCTGHHKRLESYMASQNMPRLHYSIEPQGTKVVADLGPGMEQAQVILGERA
ncbi:MAG: hypothetical protein KIS61_17695 [Candidatus Eremiobacteraeota bacterium]|nr:hypothetical protein [Candidatus Eremiobacteraeota bacterium]